MQSLSIVFKTRKKNVSLFKGDARRAEGFFHKIMLLKRKIPLFKKQDF
ncbi:MAG TPA: hypothetical protein VEC36_01025 [Patescibacteria group bacterium]|nr:hypothetical protein [Patescibacteria group bacterium]